MHALVLALFGAALVHVAVLLLVPSFSLRDTWSALAERSNYYTMTRLDSQSGDPLISSLDPLFLAAACRFDLAEGVVHVGGGGHVPYWSMSVYDRAGQNVFSLNDRSSSGKTPDFVVASPVQMIDLRNALPAQFDRSVFIQAETDEGIVVVRAFAPDESWRPTVAKFLQEISCTPF